MKPDLTFCKNKRVCVALSGGGDSVALLHYLHARATEYGITLSAVNCEHGIRGASSVADSSFVKDFCKRLDVPLFFFSADCPALARAQKISLETAARDFRYGCFRKILQEGRADVIATAHHADDNAETVLFRLCRGSSLTGVSGIRPRRGFVRPLLSVSKREILDYLQENGLSCCQDETNGDDSITRNALRLRVLPELERIIPGATKGINRFAMIAAADDEYLYRQAEALICHGQEGHSVKLSDEISLFSRACLCVLKDMGLEKDYTFAHLEALVALCGGQNGGRATLPQNITAIREYDRISCYRAGKAENGEIPFDLGVFTLGGVRFYVERVQERKDGHGYVDLNKIPPTAVFRNRREGDVFEKFGGGKKKLKDYLIDEKVPRRLRDGLVLLADGKEILAIVGREISEKLKVGNKADIGCIDIQN